MPKFVTIAQNYIEYIAFRLFIGLFRLMPYRLSRRIAFILFYVIGYKIGIRKKVAATQLIKVFPSLSPKELSSLLWKIYRSMALSALESYVMDDDDLVNSTTVEGKEHVDQALAMGKGAILATCHFGNWEAARVLPTKGIPVAVIVKKQRNTLFNDYTEKVRKKQGANLIDMKKAMRGIKHHLKQNEMIAILADQNAGKNGLITDFLGFPASHWIGAAKISLKHKIPIVPGFALRTETETINVVFEPVIFYPDKADTEENCLLIINEINTIFERYIRKYPEQWFWVHKRWKSAYDMFK